MTVEQIKATLAYLDDEMRRPAQPSCRPAIETGGCTNPRCTSCSQRPQR
ncbi:hypothetical protein ABZ917_17115 [Nonomuraea wenchangensis]